VKLWLNKSYSIEKHLVRNDFFTEHRKTHFTITNYRSSNFEGWFKWMFLLRENEIYYNNNMNVTYNRNIYDLIRKICFQAKATVERITDKYRFFFSTDQIKFYFFTRLFVYCERSLINRFNMADSLRRNLSNVESLL